MKKTIKLDIEKPADARTYIKAWVEAFERSTGKVTDYVTMSGGRKIEFATMSDEDAVAAAIGLYKMNAEVDILRATPTRTAH
jgi:hypothetical protein